MDDQWLTIFDVALLVPSFPTFSQAMQGPVAAIPEANCRSGASLHLDARPAPRFHGEAPEPRPGMRLGHAPRSVSLPAGSVLKGTKLGIDGGGFPGDGFGDGLFLGLEHLLFFHIVGIMIPTDYIIFFRGVETTNQFCIPCKYRKRCGKSGNLWENHETGESPTSTMVSGGV